MFVLDLILYLCLGCIAFQDLKFRLISWYFLPLLLAGFVFKGIQEQGPSEFLLTSSFNLGFVILQLLLLTLYISLKNRKFINIINTYIGIGDVLFFVVLCTAFSTLNFIAFYVLALMITIFGVAIFHLFSKGKTKEIPLAGSMAIVLIIVIFSSSFYGVSRYADAPLLNVFS
jgi:hypothetical protein